MSQKTVYKLFVKGKSGKWQMVGPGYSNGFPFLFESTVGRAEEHYRSLGLKTRIEEMQMEFDDR
jgi:hypothetical protein